MRTLPLLTSAVVGLSAVAAMTGPVSAAPPGDGTVPGAWIVVLEDGASPRTVADDHRRRHGADVDHVYEHALRGYAARMSDAAASEIARDRRVASVQRDREVHATAETVPTGISRIGASTSALASSGTDVDVAVIDTGIAAHRDLNVVGGVDCSGDRTGVTDDGDGHGTHVAGTIGAANDGAGVVGVAPGARLHAVKVLSDDGSGSWSDVICGIDWVTRNGAIEVANMSLGGRGSEPTGSGCSTGDALHDAICTSVAGGTTYVVAAGNSGRDAKGFAPAAYDEVITVSAMADSDGAPGGTWSASCRSGEVEESLASFSNYGLDVDVAAPGVCILSTWPDQTQNTISGTSMASPHVAGAAALVTAANPSWTPAQVRDRLVATGNGGWTDTSPDGVEEPLVDVAALLTTTPPAEEPVAGPAIVLSGTAYKVKGVKTVELTWDQAESGGTSVITRNGTALPLTEDDGYYKETISGKGGGTYTYQVCDQGDTASCSNLWTATF